MCKKSTPSLKGKYLEAGAGAHAHVVALHGLPAQALMPQIAQVRHLFCLSNILACIWAHISPQDAMTYRANMPIRG